MTQHSHLTKDPYAGRDRPVRLYALVVGIVFLLAGAAGFIPGITTNVDEITFAGHMSEARLLDFFAVSVLHNLVHLAFGVAGIALSRAPKPATAYLIWGGVAYLGLWVYGLVVDYDSDANFVPLNDADNWLHLGLGVGMIALGLLGRQQWRGTNSENL